MYLGLQSLARVDEINGVKGFMRAKECVTFWG